jgi:hypothetical protein
MKTILLLILSLHFFNSNLIDRSLFFCSPIKTSEKQLLDRFDHNKYIAVEGYYISEAEFIIIRSTDPSLKIKNKYKVYEFGPFGSGCEMYEMESNIQPKSIGKLKLRLLIAYKNRSTNEKIVTPIFWDEGLELYNNRTIISQEQDGIYITSLQKIRKWLFNDKKVSINWKKKVPENNN